MKTHADPYNFINKTKLCLTTHNISTEKLLLFIIIIKNVNV